MHRERSAARSLRLIMTASDRICRSGCGALKGAEPESCGVTLARSIVFFTWFIAHTARCNCKRRPAEQPSIIYFFSLLSQIFRAAGAEASWAAVLNRLVFLCRVEANWRTTTERRAERCCTRYSRLNYSKCAYTRERRDISRLQQRADYFIFSLTRRCPEVGRQWVAA